MVRNSLHLFRSTHVPGVDVPVNHMKRLGAEMRHGDGDRRTHLDRPPPHFAHFVRLVPTRGGTASKTTRTPLGQRSPDARSWRRRGTRALVGGGGRGARRGHVGVEKVLAARRVDQPVTSDRSLVLADQKEHVRRLVVFRQAAEVLE